MDKRRLVKGAQAMTLEEIAETLKCSKSQVYQTLQSGLRKLREDPMIAEMYGMAKILDANRQGEVEWI